MISLHRIVLGLESPLSLVRRGAGETDSEDEELVSLSAGRERLSGEPAPEDLN